MDTIYEKNLKEKIRYPVFLFLIMMGSLQMFGDLFNFPKIKAFALALQTSPAAKVFTAQEGFETYSSYFYLDWINTAGVKQTLHITPKEYYHGIVGPYNRRNAYGAAISYSPVLYKNPQTRPMLESVLYYSFCGNAPIVRELGINNIAIPNTFTVRIKPRQNLPADHLWRLSYDINCS